MEKKVPRKLYAKLYGEKREGEIKLFYGYNDERCKERK